jgi:hypothetical protein
MDQAHIRPWVCGNSSNTDQVGVKQIPETKPRPETRKAREPSRVATLETRIISTNFGFVLPVPK